MSYNVAIVTDPIPADDAAWEAVDALIDEKGPPPAVFKELYDRVTAKYPCICSLPDDQVDDGLWSDGPLWNNFGHRAAVLGMVYSKVGEGLPFLVRTANELGLTLFDWAGPTIYRPNQPPSRKRPPSILQQIRRWLSGWSGNPKGTGDSKGT